VTVWYCVRQLFIHMLYIDMSISVLRGVVVITPTQVLISIYSKINKAGCVRSGTLTIRLLRYHHYLNTRAARC
jgi:hypothetical protein